MSTQMPPYQDEGATQRYGGQPGGGEARGMWSTAPVQSRKGKPFFLTSEFLVLLAAVLTIVIAAAIADNFKAPQAWSLITLLGSAYIISRGLSKIGSHSSDRG